MLTRHLTYSCGRIVTATLVAAAGLVVIGFTVESQATNDIGAAQTKVVAPLTNCNAKADKLMTLMEATAPVIR